MSKLQTRKARHHRTERNSTHRDRNLLRVKSPGNSSGAAAAFRFLISCMHVQLVWKSGNFTGSSVPLIESLKSKTGER
jgi:hypothetical protein